MSAHTRRAGTNPSPRRLFQHLPAFLVPGLVLAAAMCPIRAARAADAPATSAATFDSVVAAVKSQYFDPGATRRSFDSTAADQRDWLLHGGPKANLPKAVGGLLGSLHYAGARFYQRGAAPDYTPAFRFRSVREGTAVTAVQPGSESERIGLAVGLLVLTPQADLFGPRNSTIVLQVKTDVNEWSHPVLREGYTIPDPDYGWRSYAEGRVGHLAVNRIVDPASVDSVMLQVRTCKDLILDFRECRASDVTLLHLLGYFTTRASIAGYAANRDGMAALGGPLERRLPASPAENTGSPWLFNPVLSEKGLLALRVLPSSELRFEGHVVVLAGENTAGFAELAPAWFEREKRGKVVGRMTAGRGGIPAILPVGENWTLEIPTVAVFYADGKPVEGHGIDPRRLIDWRQADVHAGADPDVERALQLLETDE